MWDTLLKMASNYFRAASRFALVACVESISRRSMLGTQYESRFAVVLLHDYNRIRIAYLSQVVGQVDAQLLSRDNQRI